MYNDVCTGANALKLLGMLILLCLHMPRSCTVCITILYIMQLTYLFYFNFFLYLPMNGLFAFHRKEKRTGLELGE